MPKFGYKISVDYKAGGNPRFSVLDVRGIEVKLVEVGELDRSKLRALVAELGIEPLSSLEPLAVTADEL